MYGSNSSPEKQEQMLFETEMEQRKIKCTRAFMAIGTAWDGNLISCAENLSALKKQSKSSDIVNVTLERQSSKKLK